MTASPARYGNLSRVSISRWLLFLVVLGGACGRSALMLPTHPDAGAHTQDGSATVGASNTSQPPIDGKCQGELTPCGQGDALRCYDLSKSKDHCGACGQACVPGIACQAGTCQQYHCKGALSFKALPFTSTGNTGGSNYAYYPYHPALGDFDGDGILDLVGVPDANATMSLLYGAGDGTFPTRRGIDPATLPWQAFVVDVDWDGFPDLISIITDQSGVTVRRGSGNRNAPFGEPAAYSTSTAPTGALLADFDSDGRVDLVARVSGALEYWRGQDGGLFEHQATLDARDNHLSTIDLDSPLAMDWNGDGVLDLVYGASGNLHYRLGKGDGSFDSDVACAPTMGVVGDLDHDRRPDLVSRTNVLLGIDGCHASKIVPLPNWPEYGGMALADLDGDDNLDVVGDSDTMVTVRVGDGKGGFAQPLSLPGTSTVPSESSVFVIGDLNRDGKLDLVFARPDGWGVFLNTCQ